MRLRDLAQARVSCVYRRLRGLLRQEGWAANHERVAARRLAGAVPAERHDECAEGRRYLICTDDLDTETLPPSNILETAARTTSTVMTPLTSY